jgi:hypothetical protein
MRAATSDPLGGHEQGEASAYDEVEGGKGKGHETFLQPNRDSRTVKR